MKERYLLPLRILLTLLILTMMLPGWGLLSAYYPDENIVVEVGNATESGTQNIAGNLWASER